VFAKRVERILEAIVPRSSRAYLYVLAFFLLLLLVFCVFLCFLLLFVLYTERFLDARLESERRAVEGGEGKDRLVISAPKLPSEFITGLALAQTPERAMKNMKNEAKASSSVCEVCLRGEQSRRRKK
jgi:hypothetical protein